MKKSAFTLAEIMIVLTVIGILTGILMPIAFHSAPDEDVMKFKKAHNILMTTIRELVNSDKYYLDGFLDTKADGSLVDSETYLCKTMADVINSRKSDCNVLMDISGIGAPWYVDSFENLKAVIDNHCSYYSGPEVQNYIEIDGGIVFFECSPTYHFGLWDDNISTTTFRRRIEVDGLKIYQVYKAYCVDIDGMGKGNPPFGYGIAVDGKIITGHVVDEWLEKSIQKGE